MKNHTIFAVEMQTRTQSILEKTIPLLLAKGFRTVNMDDIAKNLGISKKTLYKHFDNKADIVHKSIMYHIEQDQQLSCLLLDSIKNPIEQLILIAKHIQDVYAKINPAILYELEKYYKKSWDLLNDFMVDHITDMITQNINRGKKLELFRPNIDTLLIAKLYLALIMTIKNDYSLIQNENIIDMIKQTIEYHIRGIATTKGLAQLKELENIPLPEQLRASF